MTTAVLPEFTPFPKIPRLKRTVFITEKIDGTNASILVPEDPDAPLLAGSRNRWLAPEKGKDNFGFANWVWCFQEELRVELGPGHHFGEWWGNGIQRGYGLNEKRFSLFNTDRWTEAWGKGDLTLCHVVPELYRGEDVAEGFRAALDELTHRGSIAAPGFDRPEGIVVYHTASRSMFKYTFDGDGHKGS